MYRDPQMIRDHEIKVRLNAKEHAVFEALANYSGGQLAAIVRSMALAGADRVMSGQSDLVAATNEGPENGQEANRCA